MKLLDLLREATEKLQAEKCPFAVAGGVLAAVYRQELRATEDLDIVLFAAKESERIGREIIQSFGMTAALARMSDLTRAPMPNKKSSAKVLLVGRKKDSPDFPGLDFILPAMPWVENAMKRASDHHLDFGFGPIPCLTVDDLILSKAFSFQKDSTRYKDLDDLQSIFSAGHDLDFSYLAGEMTRLRLSLPKEWKKKLPKPLRLFCKR